ncbi:hypothetical protein [Flavobacterium sp.]|jgi:tetratricopeptide (TPR) repeat protein|uniref:hypothetical protein n=1 Tax=Flavobacterium sp. TaxID=239 RepID=UPI0037BF710F
MYNKWLSICVSFFFVSISLAQSNSRYKKLYDEFVKVQFSQPELSRQYLDSILVLSKMPDSLVSKAYNNYGIYYAVTGNYRKAIWYFNKSYTFDKKISKRTRANILCNIANTQKMAGDFNYAINNYTKAKKIYESMEDKKNIFKVESEISSVYYSMSDYSMALDISSDLIQKLEKFKDEKLISIQKLRHANILFNIADFDDAIKYYKMTLPYFSKDIENNIQNKYVALMNIGECYSELNNSNALKYFNEALSGFKKISDKRNENLCLSRIGKFYYKRNELNKSLPFLKQSFEFMYDKMPHLSTEIFVFYLKNLIDLNKNDEINKVLKLDQSKILENANLQEEIFYYKNLAFIKNKQGNIDAEYKVLKKLEELYEEREEKNTFEELQKKLNQYNIKNEIQKNKNLELMLANANLQKWITFLTVFFLIILSYYIIDKYKKKNKIQQLQLAQLAQEKEWHQNTKLLLEEKLKVETELVEIKERELTAMQLKKYQLKSRIVDFLSATELIQDKKQVDKIVKKVNSYFDNEDYWNEFQIKFTKMHPNFINALKIDYPSLTKKDIDFLILTKLNLSNKEIASLINISYESVLSKKYLLRKKMGIGSDNELVTYLSQK